ncbi:MAG: hypothetical protein HRU19_32345 [Pseudobacteriovorax sp.]|nr:hypothetical protein [Pseudobacteriovorax sp.]
MERVISYLALSVNGSFCIGYLYAYVNGKDPNNFLPYLLMFATMFSFSSQVKYSIYRAASIYCVCLATTFLAHEGEEFTKNVIYISNSFVINLLASFGITKGFILVATSIVIISDQKFKFQKQSRHFSSQIDKAFYPHQLKMIDVFEELVSTMPTQPGHGMILEMDVIKSGELEKETWELIRREMFQECYKELDSKYDLKNVLNHGMPSSLGHLHEEMGDALRITIGYPFPVPEGYTLLSSAMHLQEKLSEIMVGRLKKAFPNNICAIASVITDAKDMRGSWSSHSVRKYDFDYKSIARNANLAKLRRHIVASKAKLNESSSIVIIEGGIDISELKNSGDYIKIDLGKDSKVRTAEDIEFVHVYQSEFNHLEIIS